MDAKRFIKITGVTMAVGAVVGYVVYNAKKMAQRMTANEVEVIEVHQEECKTE